MGKKKEPSFRLIISEKTKDLAGDYLENLGFYNPRPQPKIIQLKGERIKYWLGKGAQASATVHNLLVDQKIISAPKKKIKISKKEKGEERAEDKKEQNKKKEIAEVKAEVKSEVKA